uniref:RNA helicase n=1 Tax=Babesia bovis TaxID=5865 RepID=A7AV14_BABBO|eukprot:XP_001609208.1 DEAD/DEAH box helicase [Babesia bovis T2Bo]
MDDEKIFENFLKSEENAALRQLLNPGGNINLNNVGNTNINGSQQPIAGDVASGLPRDVNLVKHQQLDEIVDEILVDGEPAPENNLQWNQLMLSPELLQGIHHMGFVKPSRIQSVALPFILGHGTRRNNIIAQAKNGSGKTATFSLALLSKVEPMMPEIQGICLCPTRELSVQNVHVLSQLGKFTKIKIFLGVPMCVRYQAQDGYQLYVGTPGKTLEFMRKRVINFGNTKLIVMDEADELINRETNLGTQVLTIHQMLSRSVQVLLFSATFSDDILRFAERVAVHPKKIQVRREKLTLDCIEQRYMICVDDEDKFKKLAELYASMIIGQSVIFVNAKENAFQLSQRMRDHGHAVSLLCGTMNPRATTNAMTPEVRDRIMREFKDGETKVLICTDVLARGIDVPQVTLVINYELPFKFAGTTRMASSKQICMETYLHRIGRTGRFGAKGIAINMITPAELELIESIKQFYHCNIELIECDPESMEVMVRNLRV